MKRPSWPATWDRSPSATSSFRSRARFRKKVYEQLPRYNFIDDLVWKKLAALGITPSAPAPETTWLRRAFIDIIGRLPAPDEVREFLADASADRRRKVIDRLLERPEYADYWANKWADLLRPNPYRVGVKAVFNYDAWIRDAFRKNKPYDQFVRELVAAQGSTWENGAVTLFRDRREPDEITTIISQLFLGIRLECAKCHHHPFEKWGQEDFYGFAAYFSRIGHKGTGISPPISGGEEIFFTAASGAVKHPLTGEVLPPEAAVWRGPDCRSCRRPARRAGPLDHVSRESVFLPGDREPRLGRHHGARAGRAGR